MEINVIWVMRVERCQKSEVEEYTKSKGVPFLEASALKTINVRESFIRVVHDLLEKTQKVENLELEAKCADVKSFKFKLIYLY